MASKQAGQVPLARRVALAFFLDSLYKTNPFKNLGVSVFSLIITLVSIALVIALVAVTIYYGGGSSKNSAIKLAAGTIINQAVQLDTAGVLSNAQNKPWPVGPNLAFDSSLLTTIPVPPKGAYANGEPSALDWSYYLSDNSTHHFALKGKVNRDVCMAINKARDMIGIPAAWDGEARIQCFGPTASPQQSYTFFYNPVGTSAADNQKALDASLLAGATATPGYPRLCPDESVIASGVCVDTAPGDAPAPPSGTGPSTEGYLVVTGITGSVWTDNARASIRSEGFSATCPVGGINPTGPDASPLMPNPAEQLNADAIVHMDWSLPPDYFIPEATTRTWCFPALSSDANPTGLLSESDDGYGAANVSHISFSPAVANVDPYTAEGSTASIAAATITAKGQAWSIFAAVFGAEFRNYASFDLVDFAGNKLAVGRGANIKTSYFSNAPTGVYNGVSYSNAEGKISFSPTPTLQSMTPKNAFANEASLVTLEGSDFVPGAVVYAMAGNSRTGITTPLNTTFIDSQHLSISLPTGYTFGYTFDTNWQGIYLFVTNADSRRTDSLSFYHYPDLVVGSGGIYAFQSSAWMPDVNDVVPAVQICTEDIASTVFYLGADVQLGNGSTVSVGPEVTASGYVWTNLFGDSKPTCIYVPLPAGTPAGSLPVTVTIHGSGLVYHGIADIDSF